MKQRYRRSVRVQEAVKQIPYGTAPPTIIQEKSAAGLDGRIPGPGRDRDV